MSWITIIGFLAAAGTTCSIFPQVVRSWRTKETTDLSLPMFMLMAGGVSLWLIYGLLIKDAPLIVANAITLSGTLAILFMKIKYG